MAKPVGYKSPPVHTRWKEGQSGNPTGRAKGQRNLKTDLTAGCAKWSRSAKGVCPGA